MKKKNVLMMAMSLVLVAVIAVGGTLAYLTSESETLTNVFTVGKGYGDDGFYLDETKKVGDTNPTEMGVGDANRLEAPGTNEYEPMSIGDAIYKDPTFHLVDGPDSYIFAKVDGVDELVRAGFAVTGWNSNEWVPISGQNQAEGGYDGYYRYYKVVSEAENMNPLFTEVSLPTALGSVPDITGINEITIEGVAVQAANLTPETAWAEADKVI